MSKKVVLASTGIRLMLNVSALRVQRMGGWVEKGCPKVAIENLVERELSIDCRSSNDL